MRTWMVTGGAGFIGSNFIRQCMIPARVNIVNLDKVTYAGNPSSLEDIANNPNYVFVRGGIEDRLLVQDLLYQYRPEAIINFAAESHVDRSIDRPADFINTNILGTFQLLENVRAYWTQASPAEQEAFRFLHVSTDEVYGTLGSIGLFTEQTAYAPNSPYSASKAASDHLVRAYYHTYGLPVLTTNCSNNYGPYQFPEKLIPLMILNAVRGKELPVYGDGGNVRDWLYVADHCRAIQKVVKQGVPGQVYNIGGNSEKTNLEIVHTLCDLLDEVRPREDGCSYRRQITFVKDRPGHDRRYAIDASKIKWELGWTPMETFDSGIRKTVEWYLANRDWCQRIWSGSYRGERMGLDKYVKREVAG